MISPDQQKFRNFQASEVDYTVQRLVKGLGSSNKAARQGFSTALVQVVRRFNVPHATVQKLVQDNLQVTGSTKR